MKLSLQSHAQTNVKTAFVNGILVDRCAHTKREGFKDSEHLCTDQHCSFFISGALLMKDSHIIRLYNELALVLSSMVEIVLLYC